MIYKTFYCHSGKTRFQAGSRATAEHVGEWCEMRLYESVAENVYPVVEYYCTFLLVESLEEETKSFLKQKDKWKYETNCFYPSNKNRKVDTFYL